MELRKIIVYSIFVVVVIYGIYFHLFSGETVRKTPPAVRTEAPIQATISAPAEHNYVELKPPVKLDKALDAENTPRRNPFRKSRPTALQDQDANRP